MQEKSGPVRDVAHAEVPLPLRLSSRRVCQALFEYLRYGPHIGQPHRSRVPGETPGRPEDLAQALREREAIKDAIRRG